MQSSIQFECQWRTSSWIQRKNLFVTLGNPLYSLKIQSGRYAHLDKSAREINQCFNLLVWISSSIMELNSFGLLMS